MDKHDVLPCLTPCSLLQALGSDSFKASADSMRGSVSALCGAMGQILVLCWKGEAAGSYSDIPRHLGIQLYCSKICYVILYYQLC